MSGRHEALSAPPSHSCDDAKQAYASRAAALAVLSLIRRRGHLAERPLRAGRLGPYYCRACQAWHLGHGSRR